MDSVTFLNFAFLLLLLFLLHRNNNAEFMPASHPRPTKQSKFVVFNQRYLNYFQLKTWPCALKHFQQRPAFFWRSSLFLLFLLALGRSWLLRVPHFISSQSGLLVGRSVVVQVEKYPSRGRRKFCFATSRQDPNPKSTYHQIHIRVRWPKRRRDLEESFLRSFGLASLRW